MKKFHTTDIAIWKPHIKQPNTTDTTDTTDTTGNGRDTTAVFNGNHQRKRLLRQMQQKCVAECISLFPSEVIDTTHTTIWKLQIHNCRMNRIELCLRCRGLVSYDRHDIRLIQMGVEMMLYKGPNKLYAR